MNGNEDKKQMGQGEKENFSYRDEESKEALYCSQSG
jgi:hypothetical protein